jgi:hypothetical protein
VGGDFGYVGVPLAASAGRSLAHYLYVVAL